MFRHFISWMVKLSKRLKVAISLWLTKPSQRQAPPLTLHLKAGPLLRTLLQRSGTRNGRAVHE